MNRVRVTLRGITVRKGNSLRLIQDHTKGHAALGPTRLVRKGILLDAQFPDGAKSVAGFADPSGLAEWIQAWVRHGKGKFAM